MISDLDTYRAASVLVKQYEEDVPIFAAMRADKQAGAGAWKDGGVAEGASGLTKTQMRRTAGEIMTPAEPLIPALRNSPTFLVQRAPAFSGRRVTGRSRW